MDSLFAKLNYKDHKQVFVLDAPGSFTDYLQGMSLPAEVKTSVLKTDKINFIIIFATQKAEIDKIVPKVAPLLIGDAVFWIAYPKKSSKKYKADFNRDSDWNIIGQYDMESVRMVAIDEDWSALRFRKVDYIKTMTRSALQPLSKKGQRK